MLFQFTFNVCMFLFCSCPYSKEIIYSYCQYHEAWIYDTRWIIGHWRNSNMFVKKRICTFNHTFCDYDTSNGPKNFQYPWKCTNLSNSCKVSHSIIKNYKYDFCPTRQQLILLPTFIQ